jgi:hypothetical protein
MAANRRALGHPKCAKCLMGMIVRRSNVFNAGASLAVSVSFYGSLVSLVDTFALGFNKGQQSTGYWVNTSAPED